MRYPLPLFITFLLIGACSSTPDSDPESKGLGMEINTENELDLSGGIVRDRELPIGAFLNEIGLRVQSWTQAHMNSDQEQLRLLTEVLEFECAKRQGEIVQQLETGPPRNRALAAIALGFAKRRTILSNDFVPTEIDKRDGSLGPLLAAIDDSEPKVAANALMALGILAHPETPLMPIAGALENALEVDVRSNAAFAISAVAGAARKLADAGGEDLSEQQRQVARQACVHGLTDVDVGVRTQSAASLGFVGNAESLAFLGDRLDEETALVAQAASVAIARLGAQNPMLKGRAAQLLVGQLDEVRPSRRDTLIYALSALAGRHLGNKTNVWHNWASRLPTS